MSRAKMGWAGDGRRSGRAAAPSAQGIAAWITALLVCFVLSAVALAGEEKSKKYSAEGLHIMESNGLRLEAHWLRARHPGYKGRICIKLTNVSDDPILIPISRKMFSLRVGYSRKGLGKPSEHGILRGNPRTPLPVYFRQGVRLVRLGPGEELSYKDTRELRIPCSPHLSGRAEVWVGYVMSKRAVRVVKENTGRSIWRGFVGPYFLKKIKPCSIPRENFGFNDELRKLQKQFLGESVVAAQRMKALAALVEKRQSDTIRLVIYALKEEELPPALREFAYYQLLAPAMEGICTGRILSVLYGAGTDPETSESLRRAIVSTLRYVGARGEEYPLISQRGVHHFRYDVTPATRKKIHEALQKIATVTEGKLRKEAKAALEAVGKYPLEEKPAEKPEEE